LVWYFLACLLGVCVVFLLNQLCIGCAFWIVRTSALSGIVEDLVGIFSRPRAFFPVSLQIIFTWLIPILTVTNLPILLLKRHAGLTSLSLLAGLTLFLYIVSRWQWKLGLKRYFSAA
ncbi:ABC-2 family transporter protein, partial [Ligilactobacillus animalis]